MEEHLTDEYKRELNNTINKKEKVVKIVESKISRPDTNLKIIKGDI